MGAILWLDGLENLQMGQLVIPYVGKTDANRSFLFNITYEDTDVFAIVATQDDGYVLAHSKNSGIKLDKFAFPSNQVLPSASVHPTTAQSNDPENNTNVIITLVFGAAIVVTTTGLLVYHKRHQN